MTTPLLVSAASLALAAIAAVVVRGRMRARTRSRTEISRARTALEQRLQARRVKLDEAEERWARLAESAQAADLGGVDGEADGLTGLAGRRDFYDRLSREVGVQPLLREGVAVLVLDVDGFGMPSRVDVGLATDFVLAELASLLREIAGTEGVGFWIGADAFGLILPGRGITAAESAFARLQAGLGTRQTTSRISVSAGITNFEAGDRALDMLVRADEALRLAKEIARGSAVVTTAHGSSP